MKAPCLILLNKDNNVRCMPNEKFLYTCFENDLLKYSNSIVVDSEATIFIIKNVSKIGWGTFLWGYHLLYRHRLIKIRYNIAEHYTLSLKEIKNVLTEKIEKKPNGKFMIEYFGSIANLKNQIELSKGLTDLIELFNQDQ